MQSYSELDPTPTKDLPTLSVERVNHLCALMIDFYNECVDDFTYGFDHPEIAFDHYLGFMRCFNVLGWYHLDEEIRKDVDDTKAQFDKFSNGLLEQINEFFPKEEDKKRVYVDLMQGPMIRLNKATKGDAIGGDLLTPKKKQPIRFSSPLKFLSHTPEPRSPLIELDDQYYDDLMTELKEVAQKCQVMIFDIEEQLTDGTSSDDIVLNMEQLFRHRDVCNDYDLLLWGYDLTHEQQVNRRYYTLTMEEFEQIEQWEEDVRLFKAHKASNTPFSITPKSSLATPSPVKNPLERMIASLTPPKSPFSVSLLDDDYNALENRYPFENNNGSPEAKSPSEFHPRLTGDKANKISIISSQNSFFPANKYDVNHDSRHQAERYSSVPIFSGLFLGVSLTVLGAIVLIPTLHTLLLPLPIVLLSIGASLIVAAIMLVHQNRQKACQEITSFEIDDTINPLLP